MHRVPNRGPDIEEMDPVDHTGTVQRREREKEIFRDKEKYTEDHPEDTFRKAEGAGGGGGHNQGDRLQRDTH